MIATKEATRKLFKSELLAKWTISISCSEKMYVHAQLERKIIRVKIWYIAT